MNIRQIDQFIAIVEQGSLSQAARVLSISQPALTKSLHQLERELNVRLLTRSPFGVQLTVFGESLYAHGKRINMDISRAELDIEALRGAHSGRISVGTIPLGARSMLPEAVKRLSSTADSSQSRSPRNITMS
jgi:DNA-binding transcriptional LysR family regulator